MTTTNRYDKLNRLTKVESWAGSTLLAKSAYGYNAANQRVAMTNADASYWLYGYDSLGQVISGKKYWADGKAVLGQQFEYGFDDTCPVRYAVGSGWPPRLAPGSKPASGRAWWEGLSHGVNNRSQTKTGGDPNGRNLRVANYTNNLLHPVRYPVGSGRPPGVAPSLMLPISGPPWRLPHGVNPVRYALWAGGARSPAPGLLLATSRVPRSLSHGVNHYTSRTVPGFMDILGAAHSNATVTLWTANSGAPPAQPGDPQGFFRTVRKGEYFRGELAANTSTGAVWLTMTNSAALQQGTNQDVTTNMTGNVFLPKTPEVYAHDADGNLTNDGRWVLTWDGENRLVSMESRSDAPAGSKRRLTFQYDPQAGAF